VNQEQHVTVGSRYDVVILASRENNDLALRYGYGFTDDVDHALSLQNLDGGGDGSAVGRKSGSPAEGDRCKLQVLLVEEDGDLLVLACSDALGELDDLALCRRSLR